MKKIIPLLIAVGVFYFLQEYFEGAQEPQATDSQDYSKLSTNKERFQSGSQLQGSGVVIRILSDDLDGSRHQRFIIELDSGRSLLIAHNIDLAPRVAGLSEGDTVAFSGVFEANDKGGVIHWTHHDPQGRRHAGWLKHKGQTYQ